MTLENLKQYRPGGLLEEGEENRVHRIRASAEVHARLGNMSAAERGALVAEALGRQGRGEGPGLQAPAVAPAPAPRALTPAPTPEAPSRPSGGRGAGVTGKAAELLAELQAGGELVEVGNKVGVERNGEIVATFLGVTGAALEMRGLLVKVAPGRWALAARVGS